jgi:hypothetical protein
MKNIKAFIFLLLGKIICFLSAYIPKGNFATITFWKSSNKKYLYYVMSEDHVKDEATLLKIFPLAIRISQLEFDILAYFYPDRQIVEVGDGAIVDDNFEDEGAPDEDDNEVIGGAHPDILDLN